MAVNNPYQSYQENSVTQSTPGELTLMLYNGILKFLNQAKKGIESNNIELRNKNIQKVQSIFHELMVTLDMSISVSESMFDLYSYMNDRLVEANIKNDVIIVDEIIEYTTEFRDTWKQVIQINRQKQYGQTGKI